MTVATFIVALAAICLEMVRYAEEEQGLAINILWVVII